MKANEKIAALIDSYIELAQNHHYDDSQIIDALTDIFDEEELSVLGYGDFIQKHFSNETKVNTALPSSCVDISMVAYALYKQDWVDQHTTPLVRLQSIREYHDYLQECADEGEAPCTYEEYLSDFGFQGALYVCYEEFCDEEYHDMGYIKSLLGGDEALLKKYYEDIDICLEEPEDLSVVSEVLSDAESRCIACAAQDNVDFEYSFD